MKKLIPVFILWTIVQGVSATIIVDTICGGATYSANGFTIEAQPYVGMFVFTNSSDTLKLFVCTPQVSIVPVSGPEMVVKNDTLVSVEEGTVTLAAKLGSSMPLAVGDVLMKDGSVVKAVEEEIEWATTRHGNPKGVIVFVDSTGMHGLVWGLGMTNLIWAAEANEGYIEALGGYGFPARNAMRDMNGKENTRIILEQTGSYPAAEWCHAYGTNATYGSVGGDWWLPSCGELILCMTHCYEVNIAVAACASSMGASSPVEYCWSSTQMEKNDYDAQYEKWAWNVHPDGGIWAFWKKGENGIGAPVRAITNF